MSGASTFPAARLHPDALLDPRGPLAPWIATGAEPCYLRLKPGRSALLGVKWSGPAGAEYASLYVADPAEVAAAADKVRAMARATGLDRGVSVDPSAPALRLRWPLDRELKGLHVAGDSRRLKNRMAGLGAFPEGWRGKERGSRVEPLRFKPGRRAVLRATLAMRHVGEARSRRETVFLRVHPPRESERRVARWRHAFDVLGSAVPRVRFHDAARGFFAVADAGAGVDAVSHPAARAALAVMLRRLHGSGPAPAAETRPNAEQVRREVGHSLSELAVIEPTLGPAVSRVLEALRRLEPVTQRDPVLVHGDLTVDQIRWTEDGLRLLDWDELASGDAHEDVARLVVDFDSVFAETNDSSLEFAREALGARFDPDAWRYHRVLERATRARAGLQQARRDWREAARDQLGKALADAERVPALRRRSNPSAGSGSPAAGPALADLVDRSRRSRLAPGLSPELKLAAVWPAGEGALARFERPDAPGVPSLWVTLGERADSHPFPEDPSLPDLAGATRSGDWIPRGHRFGRRAALQRSDGSVFRHLRPARSAEARRAWRERVHAWVRERGVHAPHPCAVPGLAGWEEASLPGVPARALPSDSACAELGALLARVHAPEAPAGCEAGGIEEVRAATARAIGMLARARVTPALDLAVWFESCAEAGDFEDLAGRRLVLVHGDLHPGQLLLGSHVALVDWDAAHAGDPEEDLGNFAAHLRWMSGGVEASGEHELLAAYRSAGGRVDPSRFTPHARLALLRVLALHAWRDDSRPRVLELDRWRPSFEEEDSWIAALDSAGR